MKKRQTIIRENPNQLVCPKCDRTMRMLMDNEVDMTVQSYNEHGQKVYLATCPKHGDYPVIFAPDFPIKDKPTNVEKVYDDDDGEDVDDEPMYAPSELLKKLFGGPPVEPEYASPLKKFDGQLPTAIQARLYLLLNTIMDGRVYIAEIVNKKGKKEYVIYAPENNEDGEFDPIPLARILTDEDKPQKYSLGPDDQEKSIH